MSRLWLCDKWFLSYQEGKVALGETLQRVVDDNLDVFLNYREKYYDGIYTGPGNRDIDFKGKAITVRSENGPLNCIIDSQGLGRGFYFHTTEDAGSVLSGFTITNGQADSGGGIYCVSASPSITDCRIIANNA